MFGPIGGYELLLILVLALLLFGPRKLPQIGRQVARALGELRAAANDFRGEIEREVDLDDLRRTRDELKSAGAELETDVRSIARDTAPAAGSAEGKSGERGDDGTRGD